MFPKWFLKIYLQYSQITPILLFILVLEEQNEELQAAVLSRGVEEGRHLLNGTLNSLAQELEEMSQAQVIYCVFSIFFSYWMLLTQALYHISI